MNNCITQAMRKVAQILSEHGHLHETHNRDSASLTGLSQFLGGKGRQIHRLVKVYITIAITALFNNKQYLVNAPVLRPIEQTPQFWYFIGDTLDWLDMYPHLTGVGRVSTELFFVSHHRALEISVLPCVFGRSSSRLVNASAVEKLKYLIEKSGWGVDGATIENEGPRSRETGSPQSNDHVFFNGLVWTPTFTDLFKHLARRGIHFSVLVHDIIPIESRELVGEEYFRSFSEWLTTTVNTANVIYVSNMLVQDQIIRWALLSRLEIKAQIVPISFGLHAMPGALSRSDIANHPQSAKIDLDTFVLSVGTIDNRKNQIFLCRIWKRLAERLGMDKIPQLVLVGRDDIKIAEVDLSMSSLFAKSKVVVLEGLSDQHVAGLYKACLFTAFSSISEGYGLPVAESLQYGKLCLSSNLSAIREHARDLIWYFAPDDHDEAVDLFLRAIERSEEREEAELRIARYFRPPQWVDTFQTMVAVADRTLREPVVTIESGVHLPHFRGARAIKPEQALANAKRWCSSDNPTVSILIVNRDAAPLTIECIRQIWAHTEGYKYEIVIADNGSARRDIAKLRNLGRSIHLLDLGCNRFCGEANNIAAEASGGRYLCMLNNSAFVQPGWLAKLVEPLAKDPQVGATGPLFLFPDGTIREAGVVLDAGGYPIRFGRGDKHASPDILKPKFVDYISAATLVVPRDVFMEAGGYDLAYEPAYFEDADLCLKIQAFGRKILFCPESKVVHIEKLSANGDLAAESRRKALGDLNRDKFIARWGKYFRTRGSAAESRRKALGDLNRDKFIARWGKYLRSRDSNELAASHRSFTPLRQADKPVSRINGGDTAVVYTPYPLTPGGGERYLLSLAAVLANHYVVTVVTPQAYSLLRLYNLGREFGLDLSRLRLTTEGALAEMPSPDLMVTMGNHVIPPVPACGKINIFHCQFPFRMSSPPNLDDKMLLAGYDIIVVNSQYTAAHVYASLSAHQLSQPAIRIVHPPVQQIASDCSKKKRMILSVGRFFVGFHSKRHDALIEAFKSICHQFSEPVEFHLAGSSMPYGEHMDYLTSLKTSAEDYPIYFHVNCSAQDLHSLYRDAFVYWHGTGIGANLSEEPEVAEHFGISLVEAMSAQAIPLALNSGGPREIIKDGESGFLYDSTETLKRLTLNIFSMAEQGHAEQIMRAAGLRACDFSTENFARNVKLLVKELT